MLKWWSDFWTFYVLILIPPTNYQYIATEWLDCVSSYCSLKTEPVVLVWSWRRKSEYLLLNFFLLTKCYHNMHHIFLQCHRWRNEDKGVLWILKRVGGMHVVDRGKHYLIQYHYCVTSLFDIALNWVTRPHMFQQTPSRYDWGGILLKNVTNILCKTHSKVLYNIAVVAAAAAETRCHRGPLASIPQTVSLLVRVQVMWPNPIRRYFRKLLLATRGKKARKFANFLLTFSTNEKLRIWPLLAEQMGC